MSKARKFLEIFAAIAAVGMQKGKKKKSSKNPMKNSNLEVSKEDIKKAADARRKRAKKLGLI